MRILAVSDGRRGIESQALGLAEAISRLSPRPCEVLTHHVKRHGFLAKAPTRLQLALGSGEAGLSQADLIIGCGRAAIAPLLDAQREARRTSKPLFTVFVQNPRIDPSRFDLVVAPEHDGLSGPFVETMIGSPNRITRDTIIGETLQFGARLSALPMPRAAFLIGGPSKRHRMDAQSVETHISIAKALLAKEISLLITLSRRTPETAKDAWYDLVNANGDNIWLYDPESDAPNPYFAFLGGADHLFITEDSTNMLTEGCTAGKSVYRLPMSGSAGKFEALYESLEDRCDVKRWSGSLREAVYEPLRETERIAQIILKRMYH